MTYRINNTGSYHINEMETLGWELTVCNTLEPRDSPARGVLKKNKTYGALLHDFLGGFLDFNKINAVVEIGGGYGYIMRDFLTGSPWLRATMVDISPFLLGKQKETLSGVNCLHKPEFLEKDFFLTENPFLERFSLAILNENIGDFPTICGIDPASLRINRGQDPVLDNINRIMNDYSLAIPEENFNLNLGALEALEKLCKAGIANIFMSEHSCEASPPPELSQFLSIKATGNPERIALKGHDEYTIKFSYLEAMAGKFNYRVTRGQFTDFVDYTKSDRTNYILRSFSDKDEHEIIRQFIEDLYKYEYLFLEK